MTLYKNSNTPRPFCKGVTLIEVLVVLAVLAVLLAFAAPSMESVAARADSKAATENISHAFRMARNTARMTSKPVILRFTTGNSGNSMSFDFPGDTDLSSNSMLMPDIDLSNDMIITAEPAAFTFDPIGMIVDFDEASTIVLTSAVDASQVTTVSIVNEMGYVTAASDETSEEES